MARAHTAVVTATVLPAARAAKAESAAGAATTATPARTDLHAAGVVLFLTAAILHASFLAWLHLGRGLDGCGTEDTGRGVVFLLGLVVPPALYLWGMLGAAEGDGRRHTVWEGMLCFLGLGGWVMWLLGGLLG